MTMGVSVIRAGVRVLAFALVLLLTRGASAQPWAFDDSCLVIQTKVAIRAMLVGLAADGRLARTLPEREWSRYLEQQQQALLEDMTDLTESLSDTNFATDLPAARKKKALAACSALTGWAYWKTGDYFSADSCMNQCREIFPFDGNEYVWASELLSDNPVPYLRITGHGREEHRSIWREVCDVESALKSAFGFVRVEPTAGLRAIISQGGDVPRITCTSFRTSMPERTPREHISSQFRRDTPPRYHRSMLTKWERMFADSLQLDGTTVRAPLGDYRLAIVSGNDTVAITTFRVDAAETTVVRLRRWEGVRVQLHDGRGNELVKSGMVEIREIDGSKEQLRPYLEHFQYDVLYGAKPRSEDMGLRTTRIEFRSDGSTHEVYRVRIERTVPAWLRFAAWAAGATVAASALVLVAQ